MERSRFVTVALTFLTVTTVFHARNLIAFNSASILVLLGIGLSVHLIATLCAPYSKLQSVSPLVSFATLILVLLSTNSGGQISKMLPTIDSMVNLVQSARSGVVSFRTGSLPFEYSTEKFLVAIVLAWVLAEIGETLAQRLHSSAPTLIWYILINAAIAAQRSSTMLVGSIIALSACSWFYLYAFERGHEEAKSHVISIPKSSVISNYSQYVIAFLGLAAVSLLLVLPITNLPSLAPDDIFKFLENSKSKTELSPLVSMSQQLKSSQREVLFTATANEAQYWRVAVLDDFDGNAWYVNSQTKQVPEKPVEGVQSRTLSGSVQLINLAPKFLPVFYSVQSISTDDVDFLEHSVVLGKEKSLTQYSFTSLANPMDLTAEQIEGSSANVPKSVESSILLPSNFDEAVKAQAQSIRSELFAGGRGTVYDQAMALRNYFIDGSFTYDLNVEYSSDQKAMKQFLEQKRGFCEQFATTYAAMARSIGIPARVVVGFSPGQPNADGVFTITNEQAHSWVEVYLSGFGWLNVDPTPSGDLPGQAPANIGATVATTTTSTVAPPLTQPTQQSTTTQADKPNRTQSSQTNGQNLKYVILMVLLVGGIAAYFLRIRYRKYGTKEDEQYIVATFREISEKVLEIKPSPDLTIAELEKRVPKSNEVVLEFLSLLTLASYAPEGQVNWKDVRLAAAKARNVKIDVKK